MILFIVVAVFFLGFPLLPYLSSSFYHLSQIQPRGCGSVAGTGPEQEELPPLEASRRDPWKPVLGGASVQTELLSFFPTVPLYG